jgi:hypothetical protein
VCFWVSVALICYFYKPSGWTVAKKWLLNHTDEKDMPMIHTFFHVSILLRPHQTMDLLRPHQTMDSRLTPGLLLLLLLLVYALCAVNNIFTVAFCSKLHRWSRSRFAVNCIE